MLRGFLRERAVMSHSAAQGGLWSKTGPPEMAFVLSFLLSSLAISDPAVNPLSYLPPVPNPFLSTLTFVLS